MTTRILIRSGRPPHRPVPLEAAHAYRGVGTFATNSGNLLFQDAIYRTLRTPDTELVVDSLSTERPGMDARHIERINDEFDVLVLSLANAFREDFLTPLGRLTDVVEKLRIRVVVTCVGAQLGLDGDPRTAGEAIDEATTRFVRAVLERSESLAVRGELTRGYLEHLGFPGERLDVVGCPSLHLFEEGTTVTRPGTTLPPEARIALNLTPSVPFSDALLSANYDRYPNLTYVPQDNETLGLMLWGEEFDAPPGMPGTLSQPAYRDDRMRFFVEPRPWLDYLSTRDFACGTRIHGNVAGLLAGIPAFQFAHDSRTLELAEFHRMPYLSTPTGPGRVDPELVDLAALYERTDLAAFNAAREPNRALWTAFLDRNGLPHLDRPDADYERELDGLAYPAAGRPLTSATPEELAGRLRWLHQGIKPGDVLRTRGAYEPDFVPDKARQQDALDRFRAVEARVSEQGRLIRDQTRALRDLTKQVEAQRKVLDRLTAPKPPFSQRVARKLRSVFAPAAGA
ncbi:polysaccharide pyruvyl transferase family protein [Propionicimonas sp.]|uniref:polysaccharide pyruvyl transferase family protein n=1 Tax=Propionicimonas sp. TaxID=1955623 RepID=UPI0039E3A2F7